MSEGRIFLLFVINYSKRSVFHLSRVSFFFTAASWRWCKMAANLKENFSGLYYRPLRIRNQLRHLLAEVLMSLFGRRGRRKKPQNRSSLTRRHPSPNITTVILTITPSLSAAQCSCWIYTVRYQARLWAIGAKIHTNLLDWRRSVRISETSFLNVPVTSSPSSKGSFATLSKASLMPPITVGGVEGGGAASRQIWSEEGWQESLLRIRAF